MDIQKAESENLEYKIQRDKVSSLIKTNNAKDTARINALENKARAQNALETLNSVEGLQSWKLVSAQDTSIIVEFACQDSVPEMGFRLEFFLFDSGKVVCKTSDASSSRGSDKKPRFTSSVKNFLIQRTQGLRKKLEATKLDSAAEISSAVVETEWYLERLWAIGKEISTLELRQSGKLAKSPETNGYEFILSKSNAKGEKIEALFEIGESYPFVLNINLSGEIANMDSLESHLVKNAKPGFGYLTRSVDGIESFQS